MHRRKLLQHTAATIAAFALSRDLFANNLKITAHPDPGSIIKLSSNENPYGPSEAAKKAMAAAVAGSNRYQWSLTEQLIAAIATKNNVTPDNVIIGAGSSELLGLVSVLAALKGKKAIAPYPTFRLWMNGAETAGLKITSIPLTAKKDTDLQQMVDALTPDTQLVYLCNPNNPTGVPIPDAELKQFISKIPAHCIILLDEAYTEFENTPSLTPLINTYPNLFIAKTFSKIYGMAGARVGYGIANAALIKQLTNLQPWANASANVVAISGALAAIQDDAFVERCMKDNRESKKIFCNTLTELQLPYAPSATSFVYFDATNYKKNIPQQLEKSNIMGARTFEKDTNWLRLSIGTAQEMTKVAAALKNV